MKDFIFAIVLIVLSFIGDAFAGGGHHHGGNAVIEQSVTVIENYPVTETTTTMVASQTKYVTIGSAMAFSAAQIHFDKANRETQIGFGAANVDGVNGITAGMAKRIGEGKDSWLLTGSVATEEGQNGNSDPNAVGIGVVLTF